jgi:hypothetical protein
MEIPQEVKEALKTAGMTALDWRRVHLAFASLPEPCGELDGRIAELATVAATVERIERMRAIRVFPPEGEVSWREMQARLFLALGAIWGEEGVLSFAKRFQIGKTSIFRWLRKFDIPLPNKRRAEKARFMTIADIRQEISRLEQRLEELQHEATA